MPLTEVLDVLKELALGKAIFWPMFKILCYTSIESVKGDKNVYCKLVFETVQYTDRIKFSTKWLVKHSTSYVNTRCGS